MPHMIVAEPLAQMLRSIAHQKRTGLLRIEHIGKGKMESGEIYFTEGRLTSIQTGHVAGKEAFILINQWEWINCSFYGMIRHYPAALPPQRGKQESGTPEPSPNIPFSTQRRTKPLSRETRPLIIADKLPASPPIDSLPEVGKRPGRFAVFKVKAMTITARIIQQMERHERIIFILLNGERTIQHLAHLTNRTEAEIEHILIRLLYMGYIEYVQG